MKLYAIKSHVKETRLSLSLAEVMMGLSVVFSEQSGLDGHNGVLGKKEMKMQWNFNSILSINKSNSRNVIRGCYDRNESETQQRALHGINDWFAYYAAADDDDEWPNSWLMVP